MGTRRRLLIRAFGLLAGTAPGCVRRARRPLPPAASALGHPRPGHPGSVRGRPAVENAATGRLLWSRGLNTERPMASITKVMTAYLVIRGGSPGTARSPFPAAVTGYVRAPQREQRGPAAGGQTRSPASCSTR